MAFDCVWIATGAGTQDFDADASWTGADPESAEAALIGDGDPGCNITSGMDQSAIDMTNLTIASGFAGTLGTAASPLVLGATTAIHVNTPKAPTINICVADAHTVTDAYIYSCGAGNYGCFLTAGAGQTGAYTDIFARGPGYLRLGAKITFTNLYILGPMTVHIEAGAVWKNIYTYPGANLLLHESTQTAAGVFSMYGGRCEMLDVTAGEIVALNIYPSATCLMNTKGTTIAALKVFGGRFDGTGVGHENILTASEAWHGSTVHLNNYTTLTGNIDLYGDVDYVGPSSVDIGMPDLPA